MNDDAASNGFTLGLDLGPNSIGWALIEPEKDGRPGRVIDAGVRVFPEGVDRFDTTKEASRNEGRRTARGARRQTRRRADRKRRLRAALVAAGLLPEGSEAQRELCEREDPYELRRRGVDPEAEPLTPHQIGRVILHLNQRRGFLSNAKRDKADKEVKGMLEEIGTLEKRLGDQTLGQHLAAIHQDDPLARLRGRHTHRDMLRDEFDRLWQTQAPHHRDLLTDEVRYGKAGEREIRKPKTPDRDTLAHGRGDDGEAWLKAFGVEGILFFQRRMYWPKSMIGLCELETGERRCPRSHRDAQRFRLLQEVNNLRVIGGERHDDPLTDEERTLLVAELSKKKEMTFDQIKKLLAKLPTFPEAGQAKFNLEEGKRPKLKGHVTDDLMSKADKGWRKRSEPQKTAVVGVLLDPNLDDDEASKRMAATGVEGEAAEALLGVDLPDGYSTLSLKAIHKLLPHLEAGLPMMAGEGRDAEGRPTDALHAAGYDRRDELQRRVLGALPRLDTLRSGKLADLPNPVVRAALYEVRKVVNAILREHGTPAAIHIELARELKMGGKARSEFNSRMREREAERDTAADELRKANVHVTRDNITKLRLWEEQEHICPYTLQKIGFAQLFNTGEVDLDHILPRSRTLDDSQMNKVVAFRSANAEKGNRTPYEWLATSDPERFDRVVQNARKLPYPKGRRLQQKEVKQDEFIARQLVDTAYIGRAVAEYLRLLMEHEHDVLCLKGQHTATLRWHWGLETLLEDLPDSPAWQEKNNLRPGEKNRADHRHHAIDAVVVALTDHKRLRALARGFREVGDVDYETGELTHRQKFEGERLDPPWDGFRDEVEATIRDLNVSHRPQRKARGKLHEDTAYGPAKDEDGRVVPGEFVVRKSLEALSASEVARIVDKAVREKVIARLAEHGAEPGRGKEKLPKEAWATTLWMKQPNSETGYAGVPIRKVRIRKADRTIQPIRAGRENPDAVAYVKPGTLHHVCLFQWEEDGKPVYDAVYTNLLEVTQRKRDQQQAAAEVRERLKAEGLRGQNLKRAVMREGAAIEREHPLIRRTHPDRADARFIMSLCTGDHVMIERDGRERLMVFSTVQSEEQKIEVVDALDARRSKFKKKFKTTVNSLLTTYKLRKVSVTPLGRIRHAQRHHAAAQLDTLHPEVVELARARVTGRLSGRQVKQMMKESEAFKHLGAQLTAAIHHFRQHPDTPDS